MQIVQSPDPLLGEVAKPVEKIDNAIKKLIEEMKQTLVTQEDPEGIGLAAPQVGKSLRLFIVKEEPDAPFFVCINPQLTPLYPKKSTKPVRLPRYMEGCLSLKNIWGKVARAPKVKLFWTDELGQQHTDTFSKFFAVILQHEYDHLQGILFPRHVIAQGGKLYKSRKDKSGEEVFDEIVL